MVEYLLQQHRSLTGEEETIVRASEYKKYGGIPLLTDLSLMMGIDPLALAFGLREILSQ